jgi:DNA-binding transcriptional LysR family regulator
VLFGGDADFTLRVETELNSRGIKVSQNAPMLPSHSAVLQFLRENDALTVLPIEILLNQLLIREFVVLRGDWSLSKYPCGVYTRRDYKTERHIPGLIGVIEQVVRELSLSRNGL